MAAKWISMFLAIVLPPSLFIFLATVFNFCWYLTAFYLISYFIAVKCCFLLLLTPTLLLPVLYKTRTFLLDSASAPVPRLLSSPLYALSQMMASLDNLGVAVVVVASVVVAPLVVAPSCCCASCCCPSCCCLSCCCCCHYCCFWLFSWRRWLNKL